MLSRSWNRGAFFGLAGSAVLAALLSMSAVAQSAPADAGKGGGTEQSGGTGAEDKLKDVKITLNTDQQDLIEALRALMKSAKADFVIDGDFKGGTVTVHFTDVPFKDALATFVKVSTLPIAYEVKDGVYHFTRRVDPPPTEKPADAPANAGKQTQFGKVPLGQLGSGDAVRKLTGPFNTLPPTIYSHSTLPGSHGSTSSFGFANGQLSSNGMKFNPDGSISSTGGSPFNVFNLLRALLGGGRR